MNNHVDNFSEKRWDEIYRTEKGAVVDVDKNIYPLADLLRERRAKRVLDLGCGSGRHTVYLAENGFEVYGIDISEEGINSCQNHLAEKNLHAELTIGSIFEELPYKQSFFDAVVCIRVINHAVIEDIRKAIAEVERVLKPRGLILVTVRKSVADKPHHRIIAPQTYIPVAGDEKGIIHYSFTKEILEKEFRNLKIIDLWTDEQSGYFCLLGEKKAVSLPAWAKKNSFTHISTSEVSLAEHLRGGDGN